MRFTLTLISLVIASTVCKGQSDIFIDPHDGKNHRTIFINSYDNVKIACTDVGRGDTTLVFIHGWSCDRTYWNEQVNTFASSYRVVSVDLAGHGESGQNRSWWSIQGFGEDIVAVIDSLQLHNVVLIGHSAGGFSCLEAANLRKEVVIGIVGVDAFRFIDIGYFDRKYTVKEIEKNAAAMKNDFSGTIETLVRKRFFGPNANKQLVEWVAKDMASAPQNIAILTGGYAYFIYRSDYLQAALQDIGMRIPIIAINAESSKINETVFQRYAPKFSVSYISDVGHFLMMEKPGVFNNELRKYLRK
jgi:pimeloyl-ACP methyl ester carboxylesterase